VASYRGRRRSTGISGSVEPLDSVCTAGRRKLEFHAAVIRDKMQNVLKGFLCFERLVYILPDMHLGYALSPVVTKSGSREAFPSTSKKPEEFLGYLYLLPDAVEIGDRLVIINGCPIPFVLRRDASSDSYCIVGCCYIDEMMDGQAIEKGWPLETILLS